MYTILMFGTAQAVLIGEVAIFQGVLISDCSYFRGILISGVSLQCFPQGQIQTGYLMNINYLAHED